MSDPWGPSQGEDEEEDTDQGPVVPPAHDSPDFRMREVDAPRDLPRGPAVLVGSAKGCVSGVDSGREERLFFAAEAQEFRVPVVHLSHSPSGWSPQTQNISRSSLH